MKVATVLAVGASLARSVAAESPGGAISWDIERKKVPIRGVNILRKRASTYEEVITNELLRGGYFATCSVGSNSQKLTLQLDTGSSDTWVPHPDAKACQDSASYPEGCTFGTFDPSRSKTFETVGADEFSIKYVDRSYAKGDYFTDSFEIGGATVKNLTMGLGRDTDIGYGLVGIGYALNEAIAGDADDVYPNLPVTMVNEGLINSIAYSLWLNDLDAATGNILFGGIDTEKYMGELTRINVLEDDRAGVVNSFLVPLTSVNAVSPSGNDSLSSRQFPIPVILDSGTTLSYLPTDIAMQIWNEVGAIYSDSLELALIPCSMASSKGYFSFGFAGPDGPQINLRMDELVLDMTTGEPLNFASGPYAGQAACEFGIQNFTSEPFLLGDTFLRSAYVVYDLVNHQIGIAATDFNATDSNIVPFPSLSAHIPSATAAKNQELVTAAPSLVTPTYSAHPGFTDSATEDGGDGDGGGNGNGGDKNAGTVPEPLDLARLAVLGITMGLVVTGSGVFFLF